MNFVRRVGVGALGAMLAVSGLVDFRIGVWLDGLLQLALGLYLIADSFPRSGRQPKEGSWLKPALIAVGILFLFMRTALRASS